MNPKETKSDRYLGYLVCKRDEFINKLVRVGAKLVNMQDEDFDLETFIKAFVPTTECLKKKIFKEAQDSQLSLANKACKNKEVQEKESLDSNLLEALRAQFLEFEKDFKELRRITESEDCESEGKTVKKCEEKKEKLHEVCETVGDLHHLSQILNPGEMSKIFVQKSRVDCVRSQMDKPNFDDDNLETIYIYRSKRC